MFKSILTGRTIEVTWKPAPTLYSVTDAATGEFLGVRAADSEDDAARSVATSREKAGMQPVALRVEVYE